MAALGADYYMQDDFLSESRKPDKQNE